MEETAQAAHVSQRGNVTWTTETYSGIQPFLDSIHKEADESPRSQMMLDEFTERLRELINDDAFSSEELERFLQGKQQTSITFNCNDKKEDDMKAIRSKFLQQRYQEKWMLLSVPTTEVEEQQRECEFQHFKTLSEIPSEDITEHTIKVVDDLFPRTQEFIYQQKGHNKPMNVVIVGHGNFTLKIDEDGKETRVGHLVCLDVKGNKFAIRNDIIIQRIETIVTEQNLRDAIVRLCLYYCFAHERDPTQVVENIEVVTYKQNQDPPSYVVYTDKTETKVIEAENKGLTWDWKEREKHDGDLPSQESATDQGMFLPQMNSSGDHERRNDPTGEFEETTTTARNEASARQTLPAKTDSFSQEEGYSRGSRPIQGQEKALVVAVEEHHSAEARIDRQDGNPLEETAQSWRTASWNTIRRTVTGFLDLYPQM